MESAGDNLPTCLWHSGNGSTASRLQQYIHDAMNRTRPFRRLDADLTECQDCVEAYHQAREELIKESPMCEMTIFQLEEIRIAGSLQQESEQDILVTFMEVLAHPFLLLSRDIESAFCTKLLELSNSMALEGFLRKSVPSMYLLLVHPNKEVREVAWQLLQHPDYRITIGNYDDISRVLDWVISPETLVQGNTGRNSGTRGAIRCPNQVQILPDHLLCRPSSSPYWQGLAQLFEIFSEDALKHALMTSPSMESFIPTLIDQICNHSGDAAASPSSFWWQLQCLTILMDRLGSRLWKAADQPNLGILFDRIKSHRQFIRAIYKFGASPSKHLEDSASQQTTVSPTDPFRWMPLYISSLLDFGQPESGTFKEVIRFLCSQLKDICDVDFKGDEDTRERRTRGLTRLDHLRSKLMRTLVKVLRSLLETSLLGALTSESITHESITQTWLQTFAAFLKKYPPARAPLGLSLMTELANDSWQFLIDVFKLADRSKENVIRLAKYLKMLRLPQQVSHPSSSIVSPEKLWELDTDGREFNNCVEFVETVLHRHFCSSPASSLLVNDSKRGRRNMLRSTFPGPCLTGTSKHPEKFKSKFDDAKSVTPKPCGSGESERNAFTDALKDIQPKCAASASKNAVGSLQTANPPRQEPCSPHSPLFVTQDRNSPEPTHFSEDSTHDTFTTLDSDPADSDAMSVVIKSEAMDEVYTISSLSEDSQSEAEDDILEVIQRCQDPDHQPRVNLETISDLQDLHDSRVQFKVISMSPLIIQRTRPESANWTVETRPELGLTKRAWDGTDTDTDSDDSLPDVFSSSSSKKQHQKKKWHPSEDPDSPNQDSSLRRSENKFSPQSLSSSSPGSWSSSPRYPTNRLSLTKKRKSQRLHSSSSDSDKSCGSNSDICQAADPSTDYPEAHVKRERSFDSKLTSSSWTNCQNPRQTVEGAVRHCQESTSCAKQLKFTDDQALVFLEDPSSPVPDKLDIEAPSSTDSESNGSISLLTSQAPRPVKPQDHPDDCDLDSTSIPNSESMYVSAFGEMQASHESSSDDTCDHVPPEEETENEVNDQLEDVKPPVHLLTLKTTSTDLASASSSLHSCTSFSEDADEIIDLENYNCSELYDNDCLSQLIEISSDEDVDLNQSEDELKVDLTAVKQEKNDDADVLRLPNRAAAVESRSSFSSQQDEVIMHLLNDNDDNTWFSDSYPEDSPVQEVCGEDAREEATDPAVDEEKIVDNRLTTEDEDENRESHPSFFPDPRREDDNSRQDPVDADSGTSDEGFQTIGHVKERNTMFKSDLEIFQQNPHAKKKIIDMQERRKKKKPRRLEMRDKQGRQPGHVSSKHCPRWSTEMTESHKDLQGSKKQPIQPAPQSKIRGSWKPSSFQGPEGSPADAEPLRRFRGSDQEPVLLDLYVLDSSQSGQRHRASSMEEDRPRAAVQSRTDRFSSRTGSLFQDLKNTAPSKQSGPEARPGSHQRIRHVSSPATVRPSITVQTPTSSSVSVLDTLPNYAQPAYVPSFITTYSVPQGAGTSTASPEGNSASSANQLEPNSEPTQDAVSASELQEDDDMPSLSPQETGSPVAPARFQFFTSNQETLHTAASLTASIHNSLLQNSTPSAPNPQPVTSSGTDSSNRITPASLPRQPQQQRPSRLEAPHGEGTSRMHREPTRRASVSLHPQAGVHLPKAAPFTVEDLYYWVIGWNCRWLDIESPNSDSQPLTSVPPILAECPYRELRDVPLNFNSLDSYYSVFVPLLLREIWTQMFKKPDASLQIVEGTFVKSKMKEQRATGYMWDCTCRVPLRDGASCPISRQDVLTVMPIAGGTGTSWRCDNSWRSALFAVVTNVMPGLPAASSVPSIGASTLQPEGNFVEVSMLILAKSEEVCHALSATVGHRVQLKVLHSLASAVRQFQGLIDLPKCQLLATDILRFRRMDVFCPAPETQPPISQPEKSLNPCQLKAVHIAAKAVSLPESLPRIFLLQGLPGTGKTQVVIKLIKEILQNQRQPDQNLGHHSSSSGAAASAKPPPILLCAPNNLVANILLKRLMVIRTTREGSRPYHIVRVAWSSVVHESVKKFSLDHQVQSMRKYDADKISHNQAEYTKRRDSLFDRIQDHNRDQHRIKELKMVETRLEDLRRQKEELGRKPDSHYEQAILANADIICCTINMSGCQLLQSIKGKDGKPRKMKYSCVIVDEANQCTELDSIIPLQYCSMKVVLIGDTEQLSASVTSKEAERHGLHRSLFERLSRWFTSSSDAREPSALHMLTKQQRMHADIAAFPSKYFYGGHLQSERMRSHSRDFFLHPYRVFNVMISQECQHSPRAFTNEAEAKMVIEMYKRICTEKRKNPIMGVIQMNIGIIVPYQDQASYLQLLVKKANQRLKENAPKEFKLPLVEVSTMDLYQGREKDVVIISCVRALEASSNLGSSPGISSNFIGDRRKMSFVLTRARYSLFIVGHLQTLRKNKDWNALVHDAEKRDVVINVPGADYDIAAGCCINPAARRVRRATPSPVPPAAAAAAAATAAAAVATAAAAVSNPSSEVRQEPGSQNMPAASSAILPTPSSASLKSGIAAGNPVRPVYHNQPKKSSLSSQGPNKAGGLAKHKMTKSNKQRVTFDTSAEKVSPRSAQTHSLVPGPMQAALGVERNPKVNPYAMNLKPAKQNGRSKRSPKLPQTLRGQKKRMIMYSSPTKFKYDGSARSKEKQLVESRMLLQSTTTVPSEQQASIPRRNSDSMGRPSTDDLGSAALPKPTSLVGQQLNPERDPRLSKQTLIKETPTDDSSKLQPEGSWIMSLSQELTVKMRRASLMEAASMPENGQNIPVHPLKPPEQSQQPLRPSSFSLNAPFTHGRLDNSSRPTTQAPLTVNPGNNQEQLATVVQNLKQRLSKEKRTLPLHGLQRDPKEVRKEARRSLSGTASAEHGVENSNHQGISRHDRFFPEPDSLSD